MFHQKRVGENPAILWTTAGLLVAIVAATGVNVWLVVEVRKAQLAMAEIVRSGSAADVARLGTLPLEFRWQFPLTLLTLAVLIVAAAVVVLVLRAYLTSQRSLRDFQTLAADILSSMDQGVVTTDEHGIVTSTNPRAKQMLGLDKSCVGSPIRQIEPDDVSLSQISHDVLRTHVSVLDRSFIVFVNGHQMHLLADCHLLKNAASKTLGTVLHLRDVTERLLIEDRMRRMERYMGLGTLAAGLHHEIKNPLGAVALHVQLLEEKLAGQMDDEVAENLNVVKTEITRISGVLEGFRDYASVERLNLAEIDVGSICRQTVDLIRPKARQQRVELDLRIPNSGAAMVSCDGARLAQVLLNLVMNALEEMREGGRLSVSMRCGDENVTIDVADTGRGVPPHLRPRIFDPYFTTKGQGSGMGLAVCEKIIRQHGGQIDCESGSDGTVFRVSLPLAATGDPAMP